MTELNDDLLTRNVQVFFITRISNFASDVRDVSTSVALSSDINLELGDPEDSLSGIEGLSSDWGRSPFGG